MESFPKIKLLFFYVVSLTHFSLCSIFIPTENIIKPLFLSRFQEVWKCNIGLKRAQCYHNFSLE